MQVLRPTNTIKINGGVWWQAEDDFNEKRIKFNTILKFNRDRSIEGSSVLRLPMVEGLEVSTANFTYGNEQEYTKIR